VILLAGKSRSAPLKSVESKKLRSNKSCTHQIQMGKLTGRNAKRATRARLI
jgi:hypothetical protein